MAAPSTKDVPKNYSVINVVRRLFLIIDCCVSASGHSREVVDGTNTTDKKNTINVNCATGG